MESVVSPGQREASEALARAKNARREAEHLGAELRQWGDRLRRIRSQNHFAEAIELLYTERR